MALVQMIESAIIFIVCIAVWVASANYPEAAAMVPKPVAVITALLSLMLFYSSLKKYREGKDKPAMLINKKIALYFVIIVAYLAGIKIIGFYVSTALYLVGASFFLGAKRKNIVIATVSFVAFCFIFFYMILGLKMPAGLLM